ncbi:hypothetical protein ACFSC6_02825 [Rufibacter sediminis]|uniref:Uncharacterized protein n=1 Tax=Rufibacter sediminis TaxID=2762756 RepID=A0ABR6VT15_9BACT|nr:hypothetical protein [Rufibacter sediminis]MBC3540319.1 hypothetical protein [Rufibacter sediminis]
MLRPSSTKRKVLLTGIITLFVFSFLLWDHVHGGVPSHHILNQKELPAISNWWNVLFLPILSWMLLGRIEKRLAKQAQSSRTPKNQPSSIVVLFTTGLSFAILISLSFVNDYKPVLDNVMYALLGVSLIIPIFYAEFILGFVLGMTFTFGAILPTVFILVLASLGFIIYRFVRPFIKRLVFLSRNKSVKS